MIALRAIVVLAALLVASPLSAAEIKVLSTPVIKVALEEIVPAYERASGNKIVIGYGSSGEIAQRLFKREVIDVVLIGRSELARLIKDKKLTEGVTVARTGYGVAVKKGAPHPDVSTPEALKKTLLAAKSIAQPSLARGGAAAFSVQRVFARLRITDQIQAKLKFAPAKTPVSMLVANGDVEIGVQQLTELVANPGIDIVGLLPDKLQEATEITASVTTTSKQTDAGRALIQNLTSPEAKAVFKARGLAMGM
jgi:molybdate transport system substrate-binding protein